MSSEEPRTKAVGKEPIDIISTWCESYTKLITLLTTIAATIVLFSATYVLKDSVQQPLIRELFRQTKVQLFWSWGFLLVSAISGVYCRFATYRWFSAALGDYARNAMPGYRWDSFNYTPAEKMARWGKASTITGVVCAVSLFLGVMFLSWAVGKAFSYL